MRGVQRKIISKMIYVKWINVKTVEEDKRRRDRAITEAVGNACWDNIYTDRMHDWGGHLARMKMYNKDKIAWMELARKDRGYLLHLQSVPWGQIPCLEVGTQHLRILSAIR